MNSFKLFSYVSFVHMIIQTVQVENRLERLFLCIEFRQSWSRNNSTCMFYSKKTQRQNAIEKGEIQVIF